MDENMQINRFEVVDLPGMKTIAFVAEKAENANTAPTFSLEKLEHTIRNENGVDKKVFNVVNSEDEERFIVLLTLANNKAYLNTGILDQNGFQKTEQALPIMYGTLYNQDSVEYKEYTYTPSLKRNFSIIDIQTCEEIKPTLYVDDITKQLKGRYKLLPYRPYIVLELSVNY